MPPYFTRPIALVLGRIDCRAGLAPIPCDGSLLKLGKVVTVSQIPRKRCERKSYRLLLFRNPPARCPAARSPPHATFAPQNEGRSFEPGDGHDPGRGRHGPG